MAYSSVSAVPRGRPRWLSRALLLAQFGVLLAILVGCKGARSEPPNPSPGAGASAGAASNGGAALTAEPEHFRFAIPASYVRHELRGEGSETLLAPPEAVVLPGSNAIRVEAGDDFALEVVFQSELAELPQQLPGAQRVASEKDAVVFKGAGGYRFLVLRELVPEWDENERRRVVCSSAGSTHAAHAEPDLRVFSRAAVERMVAACRSLELPQLE